MLVILVVVAVVSVVTLIAVLLRNSDSALARFEKSIRDEVARNREELSNSLKNSNEMLLGLTKINEEKLTGIRDTVEQRLRSLQDDNAQKLDKMRETVDEKLHSTLEKRLGESFKLVSDRLESVQKGLGEMQELASGVGDLKNVLTNVKTRGTLGEIQLGTLLEEVLAPGQYETNVQTNKNSSDSVEFAVKLPGKNESPVWLPIDAKFPREDYERLLAAQDAADAKLVETSARALEARIKDEAKKINRKYIDPPNTTDFAILFLATEGLYAEAIRRPGLFELLQREHRVMLAGPTTILALLNSLQMGFRTLAIEKRASEVWSLLGAVKSEFGKFGGILSTTQKQLKTITNTIESAERKTRTIERRLKDVEALPEKEAERIIPNEEAPPEEQNEPAV